MYRANSALSALYTVLLCAVSEHRTLYYDDVPRGALAALLSALAAVAAAWTRLHPTVQLSQARTGVHDCCRS